MVHMCKRIISPDVFQIFEGQKMAQNDKKKKIVSLRVSGTVPHMIVFFGAPV